MIKKKTAWSIFGFSVILNAAYFVVGFIYSIVYVKSVAPGLVVFSTRLLSDLTLAIGFALLVLFFVRELKKKSWGWKVFLLAAAIVPFLLHTSYIFVYPLAALLYLLLGWKK